MSHRYANNANDFSVNSAVKSVNQVDQFEENSTMRTLADSLPWVISILAHIALFLVLLFVVLFEGEDPSAGEEANAVKAITISSPKIEAGKFSKNPEAAKSVSKTLATSPVPSPAESVSNDVSETQINMVGKIGAAGGKPSGRKGLLPQGKQAGSTGTEIWGQNTSARNIIYLMDISGSMQANLSTVKRELYQSLAKLKSGHAFHMVFFSDEKPLVLGNWSKLKPATQRNKRKACKFVKDLVAAGSTDAVKSIGKTFAIYNNSKKFLTGSTVIYLLTDENFDNPQKVLSMVKKLAESNKNIAICTFLYCDSEENEPEAVDTLRQIAKITGGKYKFVEAE